MTTDSAAAHRTIDAVWRIESARIIAGLARLVRDVGLAEELAQDALVAALEQWPVEGIPARPGAWLMLTAKHRAIDHIRRDERLAGKLRDPQDRPPIRPPWKASEIVSRLTASASGPGWPAAISSSSESGYGCTRGIAATDGPEAGPARARPCTPSRPRRPVDHKAPLR